MPTTTETYRQRIERETAEATELVWRLKDDPMWRITNWTNRTAMAIYLGGSAAPGVCLHAVVADNGGIEVWRVGMNVSCVKSFSTAFEPVDEAFALAVEFARKVTR
jgi:hypothetical protein